MACTGTVNNGFVVATLGRTRSGLRAACGPVSVLALITSLAGCAGMVSGFASHLSSAILDQEDVRLVKDGAPAYLLLLDSFAASSPDNPDILAAAARLYAVYGIAFVTDHQRAKVLTQRARAYGTRSLCAADHRACKLDRGNFDRFSRTIGKVRRASAGALLSYCIGTLAYIRTHSDDVVAIADLPKVEVALEHLLSIGPGNAAASVNMYLGILNSLRPPALGGKPEKARAFFEKALELSHGADLSVKVEYARGYARMVYNRKLHDRLLNEVMAAEVKQPGLTLMNELARRQAADLLASADEYF